MISLLFSPSAEEDLQQAYHWYEERQEGLGEDFLSCFETALAEVRERPLAFPVIYKTVRRILLRRFPYAIYYVVNNSAVAVIAVFHCHRDPNRWRKRIS